MRKNKAEQKQIAKEFKQGVIFGAILTFFSIHLIAFNKNVGGYFVDYPGRLFGILLMGMGIWSLWKGVAYGFKPQKYGFLIGKIPILGLMLQDKYYYKLTGGKARFWAILAILIGLGLVFLRLPA